MAAVSEAMALLVMSGVQSSICSGLSLRRSLKRVGEVQLSVKFHSRAKK